MDVAKVFQNGRSQAVRLPKEYRFEESEVYIKKIDDIVLLIPKKSTSWKVFESSVNYFTEDFMPERKQPKTQKREDIK